MTMTAPMLADILRQPAMLGDLLARRDALAAIGARHLAGRDLTLFGCGDGWYAARAVASVSSGLFGLKVQAATSLEVASVSRPAGSAGGAVGISMSGSVDRTNDAAAGLVAAGVSVVALSNEDGGALGRITGTVASLHVPDIAPFLTGTTRYSATILALLFLLEGADPGVALPETPLACWVERDLAATLDTVGAAMPAICDAVVAQGLGGVRVLGAGADWATADYGAAKLVKLLAQPVWGAEIEEFAHSQFWSSRRDELVVLLAGTAASARLAQNTAEALAAAGMRTLAIDGHDHPVTAATWRLTLPPFPAWLAPLAVPVPLQLLSYHLARACGRDPDASQDSADPGRFRAAQLLSRRCELVP